MHCRFRFALYYVCGGFGRLKKYSIFGHLVWKCGVNTLTFSEKLLLISSKGYLIIIIVSQFFSFAALLQKTGHFKKMVICKTNLHLEDNVLAKIFMTFLKNFLLGIKNLCFVVAFWESTKPASYFENTKMHFFKERRWYEWLLLLWKAYLSF